MLILSCGIGFLLIHLAASWVNPGQYDITKRLHLESPRKWNLLKPDSLWMRWTSDKMHGSCSLDLLGYTENSAESISKSETPFSIMASESFTADMKEARVNALNLGFKCIASSADNPCALYHIGYFELKCKSVKNVVLVSPVVPLGWLVRHYYETIKWDTWAHSHCLNWYNSEDSKVREAITSVHCNPLPVYAEASAAEYSYFELQHPNFTWSKFAMFSKESLQTVNIVPAGQKCFLSSVDSAIIHSKMHAAPVAICCYVASPSKKGGPPKKNDWAFLFKEIEQPDDFMVHGSTAFRSHPAGVETFEDEYLPGQVPMLSHWYWDLLPYRYCCIWWSGATCTDYYHKARPSPKIENPPVSFKTAFLLGNVIAHPFDASPFMCSEIGEYWLLVNDDFRISVKAEPVSKSIDAMEVKKSPQRQLSIGTFVTELAIEVNSTPHLIFRFVNEKDRFRSHLHIIDTNLDGESVSVDKISGLKFFGHLSVSDENVDMEGLSITSVAMTAKGGQQLGLSLMRPRFGQEFMSILVQAVKNLTINEGLLGNGDATDNENATTSRKSKSTKTGLNLGGRIDYSDTICNANLVPLKDSLFSYVPKPKKPTTETGDRVANIKKVATSVLKKKLSTTKAKGGSVASKKTVSKGSSNEGPGKTKDDSTATKKTAIKREKREADKTDKEEADEDEAEKEGSHKKQEKTKKPSTTKDGDKNASPAKAAVKTQSPKPKPKRVSKKLTLGSKSLGQARDIACMSTSFEHYCEAIDSSLQVMKSWSNELNYFNPNKRKFRYCTQLPDERGIQVKRFEHLENVGLERDKIMPITCVFPFKSTQDYEAKCETRGKFEEFTKPGSFACNLPKNVQKTDDKAAGFFKGNNGTSIYNQHVEADKPRISGRRGIKSTAVEREKMRRLLSRARQIVADGSLLISTITVYCMSILYDRFYLLLG